MILLILLLMVRMAMTIIPCSRVLLAKLTVPQLIKKIFLILCKPEVHYRVHKNSQIVPVQGQKILSTSPILYPNLIFNYNNKNNNIPTYYRFINKVHTEAEEGVEHQHFFSLMLKKHFNTEHLIHNNATRWQ